MEIAAKVDVKVVTDRDRERAGAISAEKRDVCFLAVDLAVKGEAVAREGHRALTDLAAHNAILLRIAVGLAYDAFAGQRRGEIKSRGVLVVPIGNRLDTVDAADLSMRVDSGFKRTIIADNRVIFADKAVLGSAFGATPKDAVESFCGVADLEFHVGERFPSVVCDSGCDCLVDLGESHTFKLRAVKELRDVDVDATNTRLFRPFREGLARALGDHCVNGHTEIAHELGGAGRDGAGDAVAGQSALGEKDENAALANRADHREDGAGVGAEHLFGDRVHQSEHGAKKLVCEEMLTHNKGRAARVESHRGEDEIVI